MDFFKRDLGGGRKGGPNLGLRVANPRSPANGEEVNPSDLEAGTPRSPQPDEPILDTMGNPGVPLPYPLSDDDPFRAPPIAVRNVTFSQSPQKPAPLFFKPTHKKPAPPQPLPAISRDPPLARHVPLDVRYSERPRQPQLGPEPTHASIPPEYWQGLAPPPEFLERASGAVFSRGPDARSHRRVHVLAAAPDSARAELIVIANTILVDVARAQHLLIQQFRMAQALSERPVPTLDGHDDAAALREGDDAVYAVPQQQQQQSTQAHLADVEEAQRRERAGLPLLQQPKARMVLSVDSDDDERGQEGPSSSVSSFTRVQRLLDGGKKGRGAGGMNMAAMGLRSGGSAFVGDEKEDARDDDI